MGLGLITLALFSMAIVNLFTKKTATIWGFGFTVVIFIVFELSEQYNRRRGVGHLQDLEKFRLEGTADLERPPAEIRPGNVLAGVRNPNQLDHLKKVLDKTDTRKIDIVVVTVKGVNPAGSGEHELDTDQVFTTEIAELFSKVVSLAEKAGKHVELMVVPGANPYEAIVETAEKLQSSLIVLGLSPKMTPQEQAKAFGDAWEKLPPPRPQQSLEIYDHREGESLYFNLGPHPPRLWPEDVSLLHGLWLELSQKGPGAKLHHRDVIRIALRRLDEELHSDHAGDVIREVCDEVSADDAVPKVSDEAPKTP
jgi:nucleotide-binding universal stress UspA family protein